MRTKQSNLFDLLKSKKLSWHYNKPTIMMLIKNNLKWDDLDKWCRWFYQRKKNYEMLYTSRNNTKNSNME